MALQIQLSASDTNEISSALTSLSAPDEIQYSTCFPTHYKWQDHNYTIGSSRLKLHTTSRKTAETVLPKANVISTSDFQF